MLAPTVAGTLCLNLGPSRTLVVAILYLFAESLPQRRPASVLLVKLVRHPAQNTLLSEFGDELGNFLLRAVEKLE